MSIGWQPLKADLGAATYLLEFAYFDEFVLKHAVPAIAKELIRADAIGSHNLRVAIGLSMLERHLALAVQALWEVHFRRWLRECAHEIRGDDALGDQIKRRPLESLEKMLADLRGKSLTDISGGAVLKEASLVGNVIRHGDGPSAARLASTVPGIWRSLPEDFGDQAVVTEDCADELMIGTAQLERYAAAVSDFWIDVSQSARDDLPDPPWVADPDWSLGEESR